MCVSVRACVCVCVCVFFVATCKMPGPLIPQLLNPELSPRPRAPPAGMDWRELDRMIKDERKAGNPVACLIHSLQLDANKITVLLSNYLDDDEEDEEANTRPASKVQVCVSSSPSILSPSLSSRGSFRGEGPAAPWTMTRKTRRQTRGRQATCRCVLLLLLKHFLSSPLVSQPGWMS